MPVIKLEELSKDISSNLLDYEARLREKESEATGVTERGINREIFELSKRGYLKKEAVDTIKKEILPKVWEQFNRLSRTPFEKTANNFKKWIGNLISDFEFLCTEERVPGIGTMYRCIEFPAEKYKSLQDKIGEEFGACGFIERGEESVTPIRAVDSFTNCMHTFALKLPEKSESFSESELEDTLCSGWADPEYSHLARAFCEEFTESVEENSGAYYYADRGQQGAHVSGSRIDVEVGGATSHRTKIFLDEGRVVYEDHWSDRVDVFDDVMEKMGFRCEEGLSSASCRGELDEDSLRKVARLLSLMPSLDLHHRDYVEDLEERYLEDARDKALDEFREDIEERAWEIAHEWAEDEAIEALACFRNEAVKYVEEGKPTYPDIAQRCFS